MCTHRCEEEHRTRDARIFRPFASLFAASEAIASFGSWQRRGQRGRGAFSSFDARNKSATCPCFARLFATKYQNNPILSYLLLTNSIFSRATENSVNSKMRLSHLPRSLLLINIDAHLIFADFRLRQHGQLDILGFFCSGIGRMGNAFP